MSPLLSMTTPVAEYQGIEQHMLMQREQLSRAVFVNSDWQSATIRKLVQLENLPRNWDRSGSPPPARTSIEASLNFIQIVSALGHENVTEPEVFPVPGGGIQLEWSTAGRQLEVEILPDGTAQFLRVDNRKVEAEGDISSRAQVRFLFGWMTAG